MYFSAALLGSLYLCLIGIFSADGINLIQGASLYFFLSNRELPILAYKTFTPFMLLLLSIDTVDRNYETDNESRNIPILFRFLITVVLVIVPLLIFLSFGFGVLQSTCYFGSTYCHYWFGSSGNLSNIISGVFLNIERPFKPGDWITFDGQLKLNLSHGEVLVSHQLKIRKYLFQMIN